MENSTIPIAREVKKIYFEQGRNKPTFEMADGSIMRPYHKRRYGSEETIWLNEGDFELLKRVIEDEDKNDKWWKWW